MRLLSLNLQSHQIQKPQYRFYLLLALGAVRVLHLHHYLKIMMRLGKSHRPFPLLSPRNQGLIFCQPELIRWHIVQKPLCSH